jgi:hypothetical protein
MKFVCTSIRPRTELADVELRSSDVRGVDCMNDVNNTLKIKFNNTRIFVLCTRIYVFNTYICVFTRIYNNNTNKCITTPIYVI